MKKTLILLAASLLASLPVSAQTVTVTAPNGGGNPWVLHSQRTITWNHTNAGTHTVTIVLRNGNGWVGTIKSNWQLSAGAYLWEDVGLLEEGNVAPPGIDYQVRIRINPNIDMDDSDGNFTIAAGPVAPVLTLLSPNGKEQWITGNTKNIRWNVSGLSGPATLSLWQDGKIKGFIARHVPLSPGKHEWIVGKLIEGQLGSSGMVDPGNGFRVRLVKEYVGNVVPKTTPQDESDGDFSIVYSNIVKTQGFPVTKPAPGDIYEYVLNACTSTVGKCVMVPIQWMTDDPKPFVIDLWDDTKKVTTLLTYTDPPTLGTHNYSTQYKFTPANSLPGLYHIVIRSIDGNSGASGRFRLWHKAVEEILLPAIRNRRHWKSESYTMPGHLPRHGTGTSFADRPDWARTGFEYSYITEGAEWYSSRHVFRSRLLFDIGQYKGRKGKILEAKLYVDNREPHHTTDISLAEGETKVFALNQSWENREFFDAQGTLVGTLPHHGSPGFIDLTSWVQGWVDDTKPNHGIMVIGGNETMEENVDKYFCTYYKFSLRVLFRDE